MTRIGREIYPVLRCPTSVIYCLTRGISVSENRSIVLLSFYSTIDNTKRKADSYTRPEIAHSRLYAHRTAFTVFSVMRLFVHVPRTKNLII